MSEKRIAIVGGDDRIRQCRWPAGHDLRFYQGGRWGGNGPLKSLLAGLAAGKFDLVIILTRWVGHSTCTTLTSAATCRVALWPRGLGELTKQLDNMLGYQREAA